MYVCMYVYMPLQYMRYFNVVRIPHLSLSKPGSLFYCLLVIVVSCNSLNSL